MPAVEVAQSSSLSEDAGLTQATTAAFHHCDFVNNTITSPAQGAHSTLRLPFVSCHLPFL